MIQEASCGTKDRDRLVFEARTAGWTLMWGEYPGDLHVKKQTKETNRANNVGNAMLVKTELIAYQVIPGKEETIYPLYHEGRWQHIVIALAGQGRNLHVINFYGLSGARTDTTKAHFNDEHIGVVFDYIATLGKAPVILGGDFNTNTQTSYKLAETVFTANFTDLIDQGMRRKKPNRRTRLLVERKLEHLWGPGSFPLGFSFWERKLLNCML